MSNNYTIIENNFLSKKSKNRYASSNVEFIVWLHQNHSHLIRPALKAELDVIEENSEELDEKKKIAKRRKVIKEGWLDKMEKDHPEYCPVLMEDITYEEIAIFMAGKKTDEGKYYGKSTYDGIRSACMFLFTMSNVTPSDEFRTRMTTFLKGFK